MNQDQWNSLIRSVAIFIGGIVVSKGYFSAADSAVLVTAVVTLGGAIVSVGPTVWGIMSRSHAAMIQSVNAADNGVKVVAATAQVPTVNNPIDTTVAKLN